MRRRFFSSYDFSEEVENDREIDAFSKAKHCHIICLQSEVSAARGNIR